MLKRVFLSVAFTSLLLIVGTTSGFAQNLLTNGNFSGGLSGWTSATTGSSTVTLSTGFANPPLVGNSALLRAIGIVGDSAAISQGITVTAGSTYRLTIGSLANRSSGLTFEVKISDGTTDITNSLPINNPSVGDNILDIPIPGGFSSSATFTLKVTTTIGTPSRQVNVDNVELVVLN